MSKTDYSEMSLQELLEAERKAARFRDAMALEHKALRAEIDARQVEADAAAKVAGMTHAEKAALAQVLKAEGIASEEKFGNLGAK